MESFNNPSGGQSNRFDFQTGGLEPQKPKSSVLVFIAWLVAWLPLNLAVNYFYVYYAYPDEALNSVLGYEINLTITRIIAMVLFSLVTYFMIVAMEYQRIVMDGDWRRYGRMLIAVYLSLLLTPIEYIVFVVLFTRITSHLLPMLVRVLLCSGLVIINYLVLFARLQFRSQLRSQ
jgi:hypothetical protein